jgi:hypothetical protein
MKKVISIICAFVFFSCAEKKTNEPLNMSVSENKELVVKVSLKTSVEDVFRIMLSNVEVDEFQKKNIIVRETIPKTNGFENMTVKFGENNFSNNIQINLGKKVKKVQFNTIEFSYGENVMVVTKENFNTFLRVNKFVEFHKDDFSVSTKKEANIHNPAVILKHTMIKFLKTGKINDK